MKANFSQILNHLRRENNLSQKKAASELGISQALLSHYENGVREPKMEFIRKACEYYGVSTDYILGRSSEKSHDGKVELKCTNGEQRQNADVAALILSLLTEIGDEQLGSAAVAYTSYSLYLVLKALIAPERPYEPLFDAAMKTAEADLLRNARRVQENAPSLPGDLLEMIWEKSPVQHAAVTAIETFVGDAMKRLQ